MIDNRMTVPLDQVEAAAALIHVNWCDDRRHVEACLLPALEQRQRLLDERVVLDRISGDCHDPVKHAACSGCACTCHRHHNRL